LGAKLQLKPGQQVETVLVPEPVVSALTDFEMVAVGHQDAALLVFVTDRSALEDHRARIVEAASADRLTRVSYPKSGQLGTDLHRDSLVGLLAESGVQPVREIAIDAVWSALRLRPG
jgi:hypothetical protein